jgi:hypothetical protein
MLLMFYLLMMISVSSRTSESKIPVKILIKVVLPAPLWPKIAISSFGSISTVNSLMACNSYFEHIFLNVLLRHLIRNPKAGIFFSEF